uniref:NADH dehydrogenase subunit-like protein n=1 Tax=Hemiarma marina TaxID=1848298 RepID=A0A679EJX1_9CRYP|nr:NADH dehydrogenase subunit-like protein [Hemiarma marina]
MAESRKELIVGASVTEEAAYLCQNWRRQSTEGNRSVARERISDTRLWEGKRYWNLDWEGGYRMTDSFEAIEEADAVFLVGTYLRKEAALLNARVRKTLRNTECEVYWMGSPAPMNYPVTWSGMHPSHWMQVLEGRHAWCEALANAKNPWVLFGASLWERSGSSVWGVEQIQNHLPHVNVGYVHVGPNEVGLYHQGVDRTVSSEAEMVRGDTGPSHRMYVAPDRFQPEQENSGRTIVATSHVPSNASELGQSENTTYWPLALWCEKTGTWRNMEGRGQPLVASVKPYLEAKEEFSLLGTFFGRMGETWVRTKQEMMQAYQNDTPARYTGKVAGVQAGNYERPSWSGAPLRTWLDGFYQTDAVTSHSKILASCTRTLEICPPSEAFQTNGTSFASIGENQ